MTLSEKSLIGAIRRRSVPGRPIVLGMGDDTAIVRIPTGSEALITTDFSLEGVHFRRAWHPAESVGHRCLARGLSDIAAMGGRPIACFLSLALPAGTPEGWVKRFLDGLLALAKKSGVSLAGGDSARSPAKILADIVVLGSAPKGKAIRRSGARLGDSLYVTGSLGQSAAVLRDLFAHPKKKLRPASHRAHFFPEPRLAVGRFLADRGLATAMIDISDGLSTDLHHICAESRVGALVMAEAIPRAEGVSLDCALHGGDDYELLFTAPPSRQVPSLIAGVRVTQIGEISHGKQVRLSQAGRQARLQPMGWQHFA